MDAALEKQLKERFDRLPTVIQSAITSADVEKQMREVANTHKLHIDQWDKLENEVMLTILGLEAVNDLQNNIKNHVGVTEDVAKSLAENVSKIVFEPIRSELEKVLSHPDPTKAASDSMAAMRTEVLSTQSTGGTPPPLAPTAKAVRGEIAPGYQGTASHERKAIEGDPYREQII